METESKSSLLGVEENWDKKIKGYGVPFRDDANVPKLIVVMLFQFCGYTENRWIVHFSKNEKIWFARSHSIWVAVV